MMIEGWEEAGEEIQVSLSSPLLSWPGLPVMINEGTGAQYCVGGLAES